jgi:hypothetical protein
VKWYIVGSRFLTDRLRSFTGCHAGLPSRTTQTQHFDFSTAPNLSLSHVTSHLCDISLNCVCINMANKGLVWGILSFVIFIAVVALAVVRCWWYNRREKRKVKAVEQNLAIQRATQAARNELEKTASRRSQAKQTSSGYGEIERGDWR